MDVETLLLVAGALTGLVGGIVATIVGALHIYGWLPNRYVAKLHEAQKGIAVEIGQELRAVFAEQEAKVEAAMNAAQADALKAETSLKMSGVRQIGIEKQEMRDLQGLMVDGILGPAMQAIEAWNPEWAEKLREVPPDLLLRFLESPWFKANILPRIQPYMERFMGSHGAAPPTNETIGGWGT